MVEQTFETISFQAKDGFNCNLVHLLPKTPPTKGPILLVHGAGVRANIFNPPNPNNIIAMLAREGYDVWLENWRASIDLKSSQWDLDQAGLYDHPAAVKKVLAITGAKKIKAIIHCQGSTSFMISLVLGLLPEVSVVISNAVSLHPVFPKMQVLKMHTLLPIIKLVTKYFNPQWGNYAPDLLSKFFRLIIRLTHFEDDTLVGKFVSFTYGAGHPALWRLENLDEKTKQWIKDEFGPAPISFFQHMKNCVTKTYLIPTKQNPHLNYLPKTLDTNAKIVLFAGEENLSFKPISQEKTYNYLNKMQPNKHKLYRIPNYSHLDIFLGKNAHIDIFPLMIKEL